jgi:ornithine cyclodeaminase
MHINAVGGDCPGKTELHVDILNMPGLQTFVEFAPQSRPLRVKFGRCLQLATPVTEFADLVRGHQMGRRDQRDYLVRFRRICP